MLFKGLPPLNWRWGLMAEDPHLLPNTTNIYMIIRFTFLRLEKQVCLVRDYLCFVSLLTNNSVECTKMDSAFIILEFCSEIIYGNLHFELP